MRDRGPTLLLTRPEAQATAFAADFAARFGHDVPVIASPVLRIVPVAARLSLDGVTGLIFTSGRAVARFVQLSDNRALSAYCVGERTAALARKAGLAARIAGTDAQGALDFLRAEPPGGRLLHLRGRHSRGDIGASLRAAGQPCEEVVVYDQQEQPLDRAAQALLAGCAPILLPLFSPRSAAIVSGQMHQAAAPIAVAAISRATMVAWSGPVPALTRIAVRPDASAMLDALDELIDACHRLETEHRPR